jgi:hypothetical protein
MIKHQRCIRMGIYFIPIDPESRSPVIPQSECFPLLAWPHASAPRCAWPIQYGIWRERARPSNVSHYIVVESLQICNLRTMYRFKSSSFSVWNLFKSFKTPALASFTSTCDTSIACSS